MKRAVLVSIQPCWCEKILRGEKTVEVRKTRPTLMQTPFKVYVYCTKPRFEHEDFFALVGKQGFYGSGKIIGEFVCGRIDRLVHVGYTGDQERLTASRGGMLDGRRARNVPERENGVRVAYLRSENLQQTG